MPLIQGMMYNLQLSKDTEIYPASVGPSHWAVVVLSSLRARWQELLHSNNRSFKFSSDLPWGNEVARKEKCFEKSLDLRHEDRARI